MEATIITDDTPIAMLTVGQLKAALGNAFASKQEVEQVKATTVYDPETHVFGLHGISKLFNVSHVTAQKYKDTFLAPAVAMQGRKIIVNKQQALELFAAKNSE